MSDRTIDEHGALDAALARIAELEAADENWRASVANLAALNLESLERIDELATTIGERDKLIGHLSRQLAETGRFVPMRHDDPHNDGPVWLDEDGRLCWAGANGETQCLVLHGDMTVCLWQEGNA